MSAVDVPYAHVPLALRFLTIDAALVRKVALPVVGFLLALPLVPGYPGFTCPLRAMTGVPCPFCGTTTALGSAARGDLGAALRANPGALLLAACGIALLFVKAPRLRLPVLLLIALPVVMWVFELHRFAIL